MNRKWRLYLDTSVFGGCFDAAEGWDGDSRRVVDYCAEGTALLLSSETLEKELKAAPKHVRKLYEDIADEHLEKIPLQEEILRLANAYIAAGVVGSKWYEDCLHVAFATVARADAIVSWNFKHIVRLDRIRAFNAVNLGEGYGVMMIISPKEVNLYE
ncbi:MAG: hypothetical protein RLZZ522_670 [Verrucomicrobiota bacterium]|jgi:predicted nucleic acid-binding protein